MQKKEPDHLVDIKLFLRVGATGCTVVHEVVPGVLTSSVTALPHKCPRLFSISDEVKCKS